MTNPLPHEKTIERQLADLTAWRGAEPELWRTALDRTAEDKRKPVVMIERILTWPVTNLIAASLLVLLIGMLVAALLLPSLEKAQDSSTVNLAVAAPSSASIDNALIESRRGDIDGDGGGADPRFAGGGGGGGIEFPWQTKSQENASFLSTMNGVPFKPDQTPPARNGAEASPAERSVIHKATIELVTDDVRSAFLKAMHLISEAGGEYIQDSALTGTGKDAQANLTLRIGVDRLSAVLNDLRNLGKVRAEGINGEDVTAQVVDLEARLRNEQRVESELLQLLEKRSDAPLKEILELHDNIGRVRQTIEQITAQREKLSRLVALATILVIIKPENAPAPPPEQKKQTIGQYFGHVISTDWHDGLQVLADTLAGAVKLLVGGLIWWVALLAGLLALRQHLRSKAALAGV